MDYVKVGVIVNTHALKGEVKIKLMSDFADERFQVGAKLLLLIQNHEIALCVKQARLVKGMYYCIFEGYDDINLVEAWIGCELVLPKENSDPNNEDEAYYHEIMHATVHNEAGIYLGDVSDIIETGKHIVIRVKSETNNILIPFVKAFIVNFDKANKAIIIREMEGLY